MVKSTTLIYVMFLSDYFNMIQKIILTGAPGSGKSSVIRTLEYDWQERTIAEAAEDMIKTLRRKGYEQPWQLPDFQDKILELQLQRERQVENIEGRVFIDRGILDGLAYYQLNGREPSTAIKAARISCEAERYYKVFLMERPSTIEKNGIRFENADEAQKLQELQYKNYTEAGYKVEVIPYELGIERRAQMILKKTGEIK